jgi:hypothetical protein
MSGNTRGKLKEHFEGVHKNYDWVIVHLNKSMQLIDAQLRITDDVVKLGDDETAIQEYIEKYPLYSAIKSLGIGTQQLDELAQGIYQKL